MTNQLSDFLQALHPSFPVTVPGAVRIDIHNTPLVGTEVSPGGRALVSMNEGLDSLAPSRQTNPVFPVSLTCSGAYVGILIAPGCQRQPPKSYRTSCFADESTKPREVAHIFSKTLWVMSVMKARRIKALAAQTSNLSSVPRTRMRGGKSHLSESSDSTLALWHALLQPPPLPQQIQCNFKIK